MKQSFCKQVLDIPYKMKHFSANLGDNVFFGMHWDTLNFKIKSLGNGGDEGYMAYRLDWLLWYNTHCNKEIDTFNFMNFGTF